MLSNTATPYYYGLFRDQVLRGEIPVCIEISQEMNRIDKLIASPNYYYDSDAVNGFIAFCEHELTLRDGGDLYLLDSFKLWAEQIFGWYFFTSKSVAVKNADGRGMHYETRRIKKRLINKQYLIIPRSNAKSMYLSCIQAYFLVVDTSTTQQVTTAPTMKQAEEVLTPLRTAIARNRGPLMDFLTDGSLQNTTGSKADRQKLAATKKGIENFLTNSILEIRPMTIDKLQGLNCKIGTVDEWLSGDIKEDVTGALEQSAMKNEDYLLVLASSEGNTRNGPGDSIKMELQAILRGEYDNPHVSIWYYKLDDIKEVEIGKTNPMIYMKASPNLGKTVTYEDYLLEVQKAEHNPSYRNEMLAKRFNIPAEGTTYFFTYEETLVHRRRDFWNLPCAMGADLSQGDDFCAFTFLFPLGRGQFGVKTRCYITSLTLSRLQAAMRIKYDQFINEGSLIIMEGAILEMMDVYDDLDQYITDSNYDVRCFGFDPYNAQTFVERWIRENGQFGVEKVIQGAKTESVPLGEIKTLAEERVLIFDQDIMAFTMGNATIDQDTNGNKKLRKARYANKIDSVSALLDAYVAYKRNPDTFE